MPTFRKLKSKREKFLFVLRTFFSIFVGYLVCQLPTDRIEFFLRDLRMISKPASQPTNKIVLVYTTGKTVETLTGLPGFGLQAQVLEKIISAKPNSVHYVSSLKAWSGSLQEKEEFATVASRFEKVFFPSDELELQGEINKSQLPIPLDQLKVIPGPKTQDSDNVTRRLLVSYQDKKMLHTQIAEQFNPEISNTENINGTFSYYGSLQAFIDFRPLGSFPTVQFEDLFSDQFDPKIFEDRIVIVGDHTNLERRDYVYSPFERDKFDTTLAELHANIFETLIRNSAPTRAPNWLNLIFTILISILTVHVVLTLKPLKGILILLGTAFGFTIFSYLAYWPFGVWIEMAHPFLAIFLCYYFFIPYRLIMENRRSWEYFQKHKLLSEVELLKTNFIGMMSHDLKTPLARIQGMTDVISKDSVQLSSPQREALDMIKQSSEDLLKFISTILNYAKIESEGLELHKQAKDINQILKDVVKKHEFLAKVKHIQLITELEPLFSIQVDPELIKQVFSNLIENAIKYSPENSKVLVTSEEANDKIIVQISDQGIGIPPEELPNIFMKFFRSHDAKASPIKGSGLGLYLAQYFVELHQGAILVESSAGQGSTFTVELPLQS